MTTAPVTARGTLARPQRAAAAIGVVLAAVLGLTACGHQTTRSLAAQAGGSGTTMPDDSSGPTTEPAEVVRLGPGEDRPRLSCPNDERSLMIADFAVGARGAATPQQAVGLSSLQDGERMVVSPAGTRVWILRPDGTAREAIHLTHLRGWFLHLREACV